MVVGFTREQNFDPIIGWELYQVTVDKYHIMFFFNNGRDLLNVANKFAYMSADQTINVVFEIYGNKKLLAVDDLLRTKITAWEIISANELRLVFANGSKLSIFDDPEVTSWWFLRYEDGGLEPAFVLSDLDADLVEERRK
jgi:hypothetical protein